MVLSPLEEVVDLKYFSTPYVRSVISSFFSIGSIVCGHYFGRGVKGNKKNAQTLLLGPTLSQAGS